MIYHRVYNFFSALVAYFFGKEITLQATRLCNGWRMQEQEHRHQTEIRIAEYDVGKPFIFITNEWDNMVIGIIEKIELLALSNCPVPIVKDYVTGRTILCMSTKLPFTMQRFEALLRLTPEERWALVSPTTEGEVVFRHDNEEPILDRDTYLKCLENNRFFDKIGLPSVESNVSEQPYSFNVLHA